MNIFLEKKYHWKTKRNPGKPEQSGKLLLESFSRKILRINTKKKGFFSEFHKKSRENSCDHYLSSSGKNPKNLRINCGGILEEFFYEHLMERMKISQEKPLEKLLNGSQEKFQRESLTGLIKTFTVGILEAMVPNASKAATSTVLHLPSLSNKNCHQNIR